MREKITMTLMVLFLTHNCLLSQFNGRYYIKAFDPKESRTTAQTWACIQDKNNLVYFASGNKIVTFDGVNWSSIPLENDANPLSFAKDDRGIIYVGGNNAIGFLGSSKNGQLKFYSLKHYNEKIGNIGNVWSVKAVGEFVYFSSSARVLVWNSKTKTLEEVNAKVDLTLAEINNKVLYVDHDKGLCSFVKNNITVINKDFKTPIIDAVPFVQNKFLVLTNNAGLVVLNDKGKIINDTVCNQINQTIQNLYPYCIEKTSDNRYFLGTIYGGIIEFNQYGKLTNVINTKNGLLNNAINNISVDSDDNLWLSTDKGIAFVETGARIKKWGNSEGLESTVEDIIRFNSKIYIATDIGLSYMQDGNLKSINDIKTECWKLEKTSDKLFIASSLGFISVDKTGNTKYEIKGKPIFYIHKKNENTLILGSNDGIYSFDLNTQENTQIVTTGNNVRSIVTVNNDLWYATENKGVGYINSSGNIYRFDEKNGLNSNSFCSVFKYKNKVFIGTKNGILTHNKGKLIPATQLGEFLSQKELGLFRFYEKNDQIFASTYGTNDNRLNHYYPQNNDIKRDSLVLKRLPNVHYFSFYYEDDKLWLGSSEGLFQVDFSSSKFKTSPFEVKITSVKIGKNDSTIFNGFHQNLSRIKNDTIYEIINHQKNKSIIDYDNNEIVFNFSSLFYPEFEKNSYRFKLEGFEEEWSNWMFETKKSYTNIPEGNYIFKVQSMNVYGQVSKISEYHLKILAPWYRTIYAYIAYIVIFILFVRILIRINSKRLREANIKLENIVQQRTAEIVAQKDEIEEKNKTITESIEYAKTIQEAILTSDEFFNNTFNDHFILFNPKDIVSGDFYWAYQTKDEKIFWVAADCTGHGVPGAFMTMIGNSLLNEIIIENEIHEVNLILDKLRDSVIATLNKDVDLDSDERMRNGMDLSICCWDKKSNILFFSGANNPVFIIRNNELIEFKGDRQPIGLHKKMKPFSIQSIELEENDRIYSFSDGYADQMGGENEERFKIANLKKLILEVHLKEMNEQKMIFSDTYKNWKGNVDQMDDVVVIGIKI